jgi:Icc-related predicted phosphoesterase
MQIPDGDILLHAGDMTQRGKLKEVKDFNNWLGTLPHKHKLVIAGNHDFAFERQPQSARDLLTNCTYLEDSGVEIAGIFFYGTPWQPWFHDWAFNLQRGAELQAVWDRIPAQTDVLITHGPPAGIGDFTVTTNENVGCANLVKKVAELQPTLHVFGHIHEGYGKVVRHNTTFLNVSSCGYPKYQPLNPPMVFEIET